MAKRSPGKIAERRKLPWIAIAIIGLALSARLVYLIEIAESPTFSVPIIDSATYDRHARMLVSEGAFGPRFFWQGFLYPFFLAAVYRFTGGSMLGARLVQIALGSLLCFGVYRLGCRLFDRRTGLLAGLVTAFYGPLIFFECELLAAGTAAILSLALILLVMKAAEDIKPSTLFLFGLCGGLGVVTRATFLPFFIAACIWLVITMFRTKIARREVAARSGLVGIGFLLVALPVSVLCHKETGNFSPLPQSGPINLYIGNNPESEKTIMIRPGAEWRELIRMPMVEGSTSDMEDRRYFMQMFSDYVKTQPLHYMKGLAYKAVQFLSSRELPRNVDVYTSRMYSGILSVLVWRIGGFGFPFGVVLPFAVLGLLRFRRRIPVPVYLYVILYPIAIILVFTASRYRTPMIPVLAVPAAAGFWHLAGCINERKHRTVLAAVVIVVAAASLSSIAGPFVMEDYDYEAEMLCSVGYELMNQGRFEDAMTHLSEALRLDPDNGVAHKFAGLVLSRQRKFERASEHLTKALDKDPESYLIRYYLGINLLNLGRIEEAVGYLKQARSGAATAKEESLVTEITRVLESVDKRHGTQ
jgi:4-amino-4-deoxy-L-arabinose transferase-like glycosyltransferase